MNQNQLLVSLIFLSLKSFAMDNNQVIKGAAFYIFYKGGPTIIHRQGNEYRQETSSYVTFFGKDRCDIIAEKELTTSELTVEQEKKFDSMIDPVASAKIKPYKVHVSYHSWYGRGIGFFDRNDKWIAGNLMYFGNADVKSPEARKELMKPTSLLDSVKIVEEETCFLLPCFSWPYRKITYNDDGSKKVEISTQHRKFQCGLLLTSVGGLYLLYKSIFK